MGQISLNHIFQGYADRKTIFKNKDGLSTRFAPESIPHRESQIEHIAHILAPVMRDEKPSNIFIYGKTGTGKSLCMNYIISSLAESAKSNSNDRVRAVYINCKMRRVADTEYRLLSQIITSFGMTVPYTGLPTEQLYKRFYELIDSEKLNVILVLDEIDALVNKIGDGVLYNMTRINQELKNTKVTIIGISNNLSFINELDPRVKSSLSEEEVVFPPYNAGELKDILNERIKVTFNDGVVTPAVVAKCAALAAQEHGDARKALDLLRIAGEMAERVGSLTVLESHVDFAEKKLDSDSTLEVIKTQPKQSQFVFLSILRLHRKGQKNIMTGDVYDLYMKACREAHLTPLTQRRVSDLINELDMLGLVNAKVVSMGRYGRTREIRINLSNEILVKIEKFFGEVFA